MANKSRQRQVILEELRKLKTHPTADELYPIVRKIISNISLATVYRNLNLLVDQGVIKKLEYGGAQRRFDAEECPHYHFRCVQCEKIYDLPVVKVEGIAKVVKQIEFHRVDGYYMVFYGVCKSCQKEGEKK